MADVQGGPRTWQLSVDEENYREYVVKFLVKCDQNTEGPFAAYRAVGRSFPIGSQWNFRNDNVDQWATRRAETEVSIHEEKEGDAASWYAVECIYSNKPPKSGRCEGDETTNPLCIPDRVSGRFIKHMEEAAMADSVEYYEDGVLLNANTGGDVPIKNSAHEQMKGPQVEFEKNRQRIVVEQNVLDLELDLLAELIDTLNDAELWGFPNRTIKLSDVSWTKRYFGTPSNEGYTGTGTATASECPGTDNCPDYTGCCTYYTRVLEFDVDWNGFDRLIADYGAMVLNGEWENVNSSTWVLRDIDGGPPDATNPSHFCVAKDRDDNPTIYRLNGEGLPAKATVNGLPTGEGTVLVGKYPAKNFLQLSLPTEI